MSSYASPHQRESPQMVKKVSKKVDVTLIGDARVSTADQSVLMQVEALMDYGVRKENIFSESMSVVKKKPA